MNLEINNLKIENSFDRIAEDLLKNYALLVNNTEFRFTEIEFYYYSENHPDEYTHRHRRNAGEWRFHNQGLDLTFKGDEKSDGGILIRGLLSGSNYVNGSRKVLGEIFESFGNAFDSTTFILKQTTLRGIDIYKVFRHLPNKNIDEKFHKKRYRYITDIENLEIPASEKALMKHDMIKI
jgi:hypothetical protein